MDNLIEPIVESENLAKDMTDHIYTAKLMIEECRDDSRRTAKIDSLEEDRDIAKQMGADLVTFADNAFDNFREAPTPPLMKATLYDQLFRKLYAQNFDLSRVMPKKDPKNETLEPFLLAMKDSIIEDSDLQGLQGEILRRKFDEGVVFVSVGFDEVVEPEIHKYEDVFWDIGAEVMRKRGRGARGACRWLSTRSIMSRGTFEQWLKDKGRSDLCGKVASGDFMKSDESEEDQEIDMHDPLAVYTFYYVDNSGGSYKLVFAGGQAVEIELLEGKAYPYQLRGKDVIPVVVYTADPISHLFTGRSYIGMIKDGAEALKKVLNTFLLSVPRQINPWNLLVGNANGDMVEDLKLFNAISDIGGTPIISTASAETDIKTIKPESVYNDFKAAREAILDEVGSKIGIQFRIQEKTAEKATIFIEQRKDENEATQLQKKLDKRANEEVMEIAVGLTIRNGSRKGKMYVDFGKDGIMESEEVDNKLIFQLLDDWEGYFEADTSISETLTTPQKINALDNINATIANTFQVVAQIQPADVMEILPIVDSLYAKIVLMKQDKEISRAELMNMFESYINRINAIPEVSPEMAAGNAAGVVPPMEEAGQGGELQNEIPQANQVAVR
jgi:hypothetical protein